MEEDSYLGAEGRRGGEDKCSSTFVLRGPLGTFKAEVGGGKPDEWTGDALDALWEQQTAKRKMKEIKDVRKDVKARKGQAFLGLPQRRAECDQTVFLIYKGVKVVKVWDFETGILLSDFIEAHDNAGIRCLTFDSSGRGLVTGGRDGCLKIWSYNNGPCLHTLKHDEKQSEVCDYTYLEPRAGGSSATPGPGAATGKDERRAGSCMRSAAETLSSSPGPHRSVFCLTFLNTQYQLGSQLGVSRHFPNGQRAPR
ncbi:hypothetical protein EI555_012248 [Monodon monoceros]|uniref:Uncharacterized protein n=1 Tax=Monodon monoceros TaxID=40151 RepID=A0A4V5P778_MONMO|nr:hypothetical protein EI555_012248 [Monodon monoceros]